MSFLSNNTYLLCNRKPLLVKSSLQAYPKKIKPRIPKKKNSKRMSSFLLSYMEGSMTVEASIAIPVFLFAILNLLSVILCFGEYSTNLADMHQRAKELSVHAHVLEADIDVDNDLIILSKAQKIEPIVPIIGFTNARTIVNCRVRKWTGYDVTDNEELEQEEEWVYITPNGEAYHRDRNCSFLNPQILVASNDEIKEIRNKSGEKYRECKRCSNGISKGIVFYTEYGNRYHTTFTCSSLNRTIKSIKLTDVGDRHACSKCGKKGE